MSEGRGDRYARIPMPWAHRGPRFRSPSVHRIDPEMPLRTRCGMPVPKSTYEKAMTYRTVIDPICKTCDGMAQPNGKRPAHLRGAE